MNKWKQDHADDIINLYSKRKVIYCNQLTILLVKFYFFTPNNQLNCAKITLKFKPKNALKGWQMLDYLINFAIHSLIITEIKYNIVII